MAPSRPDSDQSGDPPLWLVAALVLLHMITVLACTEATEHRLMTKRGSMTQAVMVAPPEVSR